MCADSPAGFDTTITCDIVNDSGVLPSVVLNGDFADARSLMGNGNDFALPLNEESRASVFEVEFDIGEVSQIPVVEFDTQIGLLQASLKLGGNDFGIVPDADDGDDLFSFIVDVRPFTASGLLEGDVIGLATLEHTYVLTEGTPGRNLSGTNVFGRFFGASIDGGGGDGANRGGNGFDTISWR